jgi:hypothetical protein
MAATVFALMKPGPGSLHIGDAGAARNDGGDLVDAATLEARPEDGPLQGLAIGAALQPRRVIPESAPTAHFIVASRSVGPQSSWRCATDTSGPTLAVCGTVGRRPIANLQRRDAEIWDVDDGLAMVGGSPSGRRFDMIVVRVSDVVRDASGLGATVYVEFLSAGYIVRLQSVGSGWEARDTSLLWSNGQ